MCCVFIAQRLGYYHRFIHVANLYLCRTILLRAVYYKETLGKGEIMNFNKVTNFINSLENIGIPGADIAIYLKGDEVFRHNFGYANINEKTPITTRTLYAIWSMTKVITCVSALRLFEEGRFLLSDPIHDYLPEFKAVEPIQIVDLFTMSAGLPYGHHMPKLAELEKRQNGFTITEFISAISQGPLFGKPGQTYGYGHSHDVLCGLIEVLTGKTTGEYMYEEIFKPLEMQDTFFKVPLEKQPRLAMMYTFDEEKRVHAISESHDALKSLDFNAKYECGGGGLVSSVDDYAKFANALCFGGTAKNGHKLLGKATIDMMRTNHLCDKRLQEYKKTMQNDGYGYGLGVRTMIEKNRGNNASLGSYGWSGLAGTQVHIDPAIGLVYVYAQQLMPSKEGYVHPRLRSVVYGCL